MTILSKNNILTLGKIFLSRSLILYLLLIVIASLLTDHKKVDHAVMVRSLNDLMPDVNDFRYLIQTTENHDTFDHDKLQSYLSYYQKVAAYHPHMPDTWGLLGFCHFHLGQVDKAMNAYEQALAKAPHFFWFHFNLAVIHYHQGDFEQALIYLQKAVAAPQQKTVMTILSSPMIYRPLLQADKKNTPEFLKEQLHQGRKDAIKLTILSYMKLKDFEKVFEVASSLLKGNIVEHEFLHLQLGLSFYHRQQLKEAAHHLQQCLKLNPQNAEALYYFGLSLKQVRQHDLGQDAIDQAMTLREAYNRTHNESTIAWLRIY